MGTWTYQELLNKKVKNVYQVGDSQLYFEFDDGTRYRFYHIQDCCEDVLIDDINGNLSSLIGEHLVMAEETVQVSEIEDGNYSTWTFYKFASQKGYVNIKWYGTSNGSYSERVDFEQVFD